MSSRSYYAVAMERKEPVFMNGKPFDDKSGFFAPRPEYFFRLVTPKPDDRDGGYCRFLELAQSANVHLPKGWRFNRNECYEKGDATESLPRT